VGGFWGRGKSSEKVVKKKKKKKGGAVAFAKTDPRTLKGLKTVELKKKKKKPQNRGKKKKGEKDRDTPIRPTERKSGFPKQKTSVVPSRQLGGRAINWKNKKVLRQKKVRIP